MAITTFGEPTVEQLVDKARDHGYTMGNHFVLEPDATYALVAIKLSPAVTPADYPALKAAIEALPGIQEITLLIDGQATSVSLNPAKEWIGHVGIRLQTREIPE